MNPIASMDISKTVPKLFWPTVLMSPVAKMDISIRVYYADSMLLKAKTHQDMILCILSKVGNLYDDFTLVIS